VWRKKWNGIYKKNYTIFITLMGQQLSGMGIALSITKLPIISKKNNLNAVKKIMIYLIFITDINIFMS